MKNIIKWALINHFLQGMIPYSPFSAHLQSIGVLASPAELHAQASALLCVHQSAPFDQWYQQMLEDYSIETTNTKGLHEVLSAVFDYAKDQLSQEGYQFQLLLPDDGGQLSDRVAVMADWVSAFLAGLGTSGLVGAQLSEISGEFLQDLEKIARIDYELEGLEGEELDFVEITEYIRSGVMMLFAELNQQNSPSGNQLH